MDTDNPFYVSPKDANSRADCPHEVGLDKGVKHITVEEMKSMIRVACAETGVDPDNYIVEAPVSPPFRIPYVRYKYEYGEFTKEIDWRIRETVYKVIGGRPWCRKGYMTYGSLLKYCEADSYMMPDCGAH